LRTSNFSLGKKNVPVLTARLVSIGSGAAKAPPPLKAFISVPAIAAPVRALKPCRKKLRRSRVFRSSR
jgi:hypothetical protein